MDVRASADGVVYVFHDQNLERLTGRNVSFRKLYAKDIDSIRVNGKFVIPKFCEVAEAFPECKFNIDAKSWDVLNPLCCSINKMHLQNRVCIASFDDKKISYIISRFKENICHSLGRKLSAKFILGSLIGLNQTFSAGCVQLPYLYKGVPLISERLIRYAHKIGLKIHVWTINERSTMETLIDLGVDGLMTDDCFELRQVLLSRGRWK